MEYKREVEKKYMLYDTNYEEAKSILSKRYPIIEDAVGVDWFWRVPGVDFIRLRQSSRELTVKVTDRGDITDRIEENVVVSEVDRAYAFMSLTHGDPCLTLTKEFCVFKAPDAILCLYRVLEDKARRTFFEAEASTIEQVNLATVKVPLPLILEKRSLFQIFMNPPQVMPMKRNWNCDVSWGPCACGAFHERDQL